MRNRCTHLHYQEFHKTLSWQEKKSLLWYMFIEYILILWEYLNNVVNLCVMNRNDGICLANTSLCFQTQSHFFLEDINFFKI